jgi:hypothetical protein
LITVKNYELMSLIVVVYTLPPHGHVLIYKTHLTSRYTGSLRSG